MYLPDGHPDKMELTVNSQKLWMDHLEYQLQKAWEERNYSLDNRKRYEDLLAKFNTRNMNLNDSPAT